MAKATKNGKATAEKGTTVSKAAPARETSPRSGTTAGAPRKDPLIQKAAEVEELLSFVDNTSFAGDEREAADELSAVDQHPADVASMTLQREIDYTTKQVLEDDQRQIQEAMRRKHEGTYGICANCGREIPKARLAVRPEAIYCVECQRMVEGSRV